MNKTYLVVIKGGSTVTLHFKGDNATMVSHGQEFDVMSIAGPKELNMLSKKIMLEKGNYIAYIYRKNGMMPPALGPIINFYEEIGVDKHYKNKVFLLKNGSVMNSDLIEDVYEPTSDFEFRKAA